ncbi:MAG: phosphate signaling complex protein PhoU [Chloroflexota bacterium]|nr:phosphate signaling complex protein PhoU [Chloroflexota bacterium]
MMLRTTLDRKLGELRGAILLMGESVDVAIGRAVDALARGDRDAANAVIRGDDVIDQECTAIEEMGARLITLQQPALGDLRAVLAALTIAEELERIADHAEGIARLVARLPSASAPSKEALLGLSGLAALARVQLQGALDAYRAGDAVRARTVWAGDAAVDNLHNRLVQSLLGGMKGDRDELTTDTYLLWVAHNLERIGDRAGNICERVVFIATGERRIAS